MECRVSPYEGTEAKAVMIHTGGDDAVVFPFMERLSRNGLRVWHDSGIRKVMVEYKKNWKREHEACSAFIAFLTENAVNSHVFRERLTNAVESGKPLVIIHTPERNDLSPGMNLQFEKAAAVIQSSYIPAEKLAENIAKLQALKECMGMPDPGIEISPYPGSNAGQKKTISADQERSMPPSARTMLELRGKQKSTESVQTVLSEKKEPVMTGQGDSGTTHQKTGSEASLEKTTRLSDGNSSECMNPEVTVIPQKIELPVIISLSSGEKKRGMLGESLVGRFRKNQDIIADISFADKCRLFSGKHFSIIYIDSICMLICKHPNGMNVNGQDLREGDKFTVESEAIVRIPSDETLSQLDKNEARPTFLVVATGSRAKELWDVSAIAVLESKETGETRCFTDQFCFGRDNAWKTGVMLSRNISREHGTITLDSGCFIFQDHSTNGTRINGTKINHESLKLQNDDIISVQGNDQNEESFIFHCCFFERG